MAGAHNSRRTTVLLLARRWCPHDVGTAGTINLRLAIGSSAELDWFLYNSSLTQVARGYTVSNPEAGSYNAAAGRYYLFVDGLYVSVYRWKVLLEVSPMRKRTFVVAALVACFAGTAAADVINADSSYVTVQYATAKDRVTISPGLNGETFPQNGITIKVYAKNNMGAPLAGVARNEFTIENGAHCPGGNVADAATDLNGSTTFTQMRGSACSSGLTYTAGGLVVNQRAVPGLMPPASLVLIKTNSQDALPSSPGFVDAGDLAALAGRLGCPGPSCPNMGVPGYSICSDWNEDGFIDAGDVASFAQQLGVSCNN